MTSTPVEDGGGVILLLLETTEDPSEARFLLEMEGVLRWGLCACLIQRN
jgi:hypothetical protein